MFRTNRVSNQSCFEPIMSRATERTRDQTMFSKIELNEIDSLPSADDATLIVIGAIENNVDNPSTMLPQCHHTAVERKRRKGVG